MEVGTPLLDFVDGDTQRLSQLLLGRFGLRHELVQRRVQQPNGYRQAVHRFQRGLDVAFDERLQLVDRLVPFLVVVGMDHLPQHEQGLLGARSVEHVLGAEQSDALGAEFAGDFGVLGCVGVGPHAHRPPLVGQLHEFLEAGVLGGVHHLHLAGVNLSLGAVEREHVAGLEGLAADRKRLGGRVDLQGVGADDTALTPAACNQGRVAGHAATGGEDSFGRPHAFDVLGVGLFADEDALAIVALGGHRVIGGKDDLAECAAGPGRQTGNDRLGLLLGLGIDDRVEQLVELFRLNSHHGRLFVDQPLGQHVHRHVQRGGAGPLAAAAL